MKARISLSIDSDLVKQTKSYAKKNQTSVSGLVEEYFNKVVNSSKKSNIISLIEGLEKPIIEGNADLKKIFHEQILSK
ncbi:MAG: hypothetical protein JWQ34_350 [Mucilaginibacter sp.]|uniref:DUF6364 family protein n=1 Tax=Mucilaginibacter sp. TaxID=1882438 RepID=UPI00262A85E9|nr:DUF6364 family protein [Mucilaginibacter sp.]MDB5002125.1 hypothetical protein [Mucilaginibacter sp.]